MSRLSADPLGALAARLRALEGTRHPLRLSVEEANRLERTLRAGQLDPEAFGTSRRARTLGAVLARARPGDAVAVVGQLVGPVGDAEAMARRLSAAGLYPILLAASLVASAAAVGLGTATLLRALRLVPETGALDGNVVLLLGAAALAWSGLFAHGYLLLARRAPAPLAGRAQQAVSEALAFRTALELHRAGVALDQALEAASLWLSGRARRALSGLARRLTGGAGGAEGPIEHRLLFSGAQRGVAAAVLEALARQRRLEAEGEVPDAIFRAQLFAYALGGLGALALGAALFTVYTGTAVGIGGSP